jgi:hypothetical protein
LKYLGPLDDPAGRVARAEGADPPAGAPAARARAGGDERGGASEPESATPTLREAVRRPAATGAGGRETGFPAAGAG